MKVVQDKLGVKCISDLLRNEMCGIFDTKSLTKEQKKEYVRSEYQISKIITDNKKDKYSRNDIMKKIIENCRGVKKNKVGVNRIEKENQRNDFRLLLVFKENEIYERKEYSTTKRIKKIFKNQIINEQYRVDKYFIDLVFPAHKLGIEIHKNGHLQRSDINNKLNFKLSKSTLILMMKLVKYKNLFMNPLLKLAEQSSKKS